MRPPNELLYCARDLVGHATPEFVQAINRDLKNIVTKNVSLAHFKPSLTTIEPDQAAKVVKEFEEFLDQQLRASWTATTARCPCCTSSKEADGNQPWHEIGVQLNFASIWRRGGFGQVW